MDIIAGASLARRTVNLPLSVVKTRLWLPCAAPVATPTRSPACSVPEPRAIPLDGAPRAPGALYRLPRQALLDNTMAALPLGIARTAIDTLVEIAAGGKQPAGAGAPLAERTTVQADVARAEALYLSGRSFLYDSVTQSWEAEKAGRELSVREVAVLCLARTHAVQAAVQAVDLTYPCPRMVHLGGETWRA